jgi:Protein of unknwon function (DUF3310)
MKFKKGDTVRALRSSGNGWCASAYVEGKTYAVKSCLNNSVQTVEDSLGSTTNGWGASNFELVEKFKKGDVVRARESSSEGGYVKGAEYVVKSTLDGRVQTELDSIGSKTNGWCTDNFELVTSPKTSALESSGAALLTQVGGSHYTDMKIQPAHYNLANNMGWAEGDAISYISRWRNKGGLQDLRKARQTLLLLIEHEEALGTK